ISIRGPGLFEGIDRSKPISIAVLDKSTHLFEDHKKNNFIGINISVFKEIKDSNIRDAVLAVGLSHELRHEAGEVDEGKITREDVKLIRKLLSSEEMNQIAKRLNLLVKKKGFIELMVETKITPVELMKEITERFFKYLNKLKKIYGDVVDISNVKFVDDIELDGKGAHWLVKVDVYRKEIKINRTSSQMAFSEILKSLNKIIFHEFAHILMLGDKG
ncbi:hypothetical protein KAI68_06505, partial [bacterium]|nr:hypothetical protein [bacterium]